ncbi:MULTISPECIES: cell envelope integrity protein CreD [Galbibacter]|uniref:Cell envelope integrity protein CreD n=1 Tax=Galbibacter pacificus TaxID=2996052 RepID=A0ABT6FSM5_9FLAO|nr:cell envelope integrity protein CreD [Galbibacter pacificus]MDG3582613.1 cell envelope integrity protein CreD [Galbibacter pacificus]MDG3586268.1 cell envelope integrity protein CreD [Galbibacter pacificus]
MEQTRSKLSTWIRESITARMLIVGFLLLVLLIPLAFVKELIKERKHRQEDVVNEINDKWGDEVVLSGPILKVPYKEIKEVKSFNSETNSYEIKNEEHIDYAYFFPMDLNINAQVDTKPLNRSIYKSVVYTSDVDVKGVFPKIEFEKDRILPENILWNKATILIQTSNLKGIRNTVKTTLNNQTLSMAPVYNNAVLNTIESVPITNFATMHAQETSFRFNLKVNGSKTMKFVPIGKTTQASMASNWASPSFDGMFLPEDGSREISSDGFKASWKILQINRQFEQSFYDKIPDLTPFAFGAKLIVPVNEYAKSERASKYGILVIALTLLVFLLIQLVSKIYIHPFQYVMIGLALVMFYTLLISISEHSSFLKAYLLASAAVLGLVTLYSRTILKNFKFAILVGASLMCLYGFIYVIIQLEDYALLVGSIGLFIILATIMFFSKKIDWENK